MAGAAERAPSSGRPGDAPVEPAPAPSGARLLSLTGAPPGAVVLARPQRLAAAVGHALRRAAGQDDDVALLAAVGTRLTTVPVLPRAA